MDDRRELTESQGKISAVGSANAKAIRQEVPGRCQEEQGGRCVQSRMREREREGREETEPKGGPNYRGLCKLERKVTTKFE